MKRYLVFTGGSYYPQGGWDDLAGDSDTIGGCLEIVRDRKDDWWQVIDTETMEEVNVELEA